MTGGKERRALRSRHAGEVGRSAVAGGRLIEPEKLGVLGFERVAQAVMRGEPVGSEIRSASGRQKLPGAVEAVRADETDSRHGMREVREVREAGDVVLARA